MKVSGEATLHAPVDRVYAALHDPAVLVRTIPGCQRLEQVGADAYVMTVEAGVAAVRGVFSGEVMLTDHRAPHAFVLRAAGSGAPGTVTATVAVTLTGGVDGTTVVAYDADAVVGGMVGGVGQRVLSGVAKKTAGEFFAAVDGALVGGPPPPEVPGEPAAAAGTVYERPRPPAGMPGGLPGGFLAGAAFGAALALLGAVVGAVLARTPRRHGRG
ncbi:MAG: carbon monoxide dehydrogenase subunit G [Actinobacteria bacterium]|nr:carbon monoxide dehydrogenase subunit G [Actinomycetota bacterium]